MASAFSIVVSGLLSLVIWQSIQLYRGVRGTTLTTTAVWSIFVAVVWGAAWPLSAFTFADVPVGQDQVWYWTAAVSLVPPIAVLGAKRPGSGVWNFFVLLPLVLVLGWPALTVWTVRGPGALQVETPALVGFVLVLVMGCGNYVATRLAFPALLYALSVILALAPCSTVSAESDVSANWFRLAGTTSLLLCVWWGRFIVLRLPLEQNGPNRVWNDFREMFGIVWMKRAMDRINEEFAEREQWPARLGTNGMEWLGTPTDDQRQHVEARMGYALHWMLRRFVDPEWINRRMVRCVDSDPVGVD